MSFWEVDDYGSPHVSLFSVNCFGFFGKTAEWFPVFFSMVWNSGFSFSWTGCHTKLVWGGVSWRRRNWFMPFWRIFLRSEHNRLRHNLNSDCWFHFPSQSPLHTISCTMSKISLGHWHFFFHCFEIRLYFRQVFYYLKSI